MAFVEMDVPVDLLRHIIGKGGQHLARLQKVKYRSRQIYRF